MNGVSLSTLTEVALKSAPDDKITVANGYPQKREAHSALGGRLVSWLATNTIGDEQKTRDQLALRTSLETTYGEPIGRLAFEHACRACGAFDGNIHSLTAEQVLIGVKVADRAFKPTATEGFDRKTAENYAPEQSEEPGEISAVQAETAQPDKIKPDEVLSRLSNEISRRYSTSVADKVVTFTKEREVLEMIEKGFSTEGGEVAPHIVEHELRTRAFEAAEQLHAKEMRHQTASANTSAAASPQSIYPEYSFKDIGLEQVQSEALEEIHPHIASHYGDRIADQVVKFAQDSNLLSKLYDQVDADSDGARKTLAQKILINRCWEGAQRVFVANLPETARLALKELKEVVERPKAELAAAYEVQGIEWDSVPLGRLLAVETLVYDAAVEFLAQKVKEGDAAASGILGDREELFYNKFSELLYKELQDLRPAAARVHKANEGQSSKVESLERSSMLESTRDHKEERVRFKDV